MSMMLTKRAGLSDLWFLWPPWASFVVTAPQNSLEGMVEMSGATSLLGCAFSVCGSIELRSEFRVNWI